LVWSCVAAAGGIPKRIGYAGFRILLTPRTHARCTRAPPVSRVWLLIMGFGFKHNSDRVRTLLRGACTPPEAAGTPPRPRRAPPSPPSAASAAASPAGAEAAGACTWQREAVWLQKSMGISRGTLTGHGAFKRVLDSQQGLARFSSRPSAAPWVQKELKAYKQEVECGTGRATHMACRHSSAACTTALAGRVKACSVRGSTSSTYLRGRLGTTMVHV
jgi:hypothetical protein